VGLVVTATAQKKYKISFPFSSMNLGEVHYRKTVNNIPFLARIWKFIIREQIADTLLSSYLF